MIYEARPDIRAIVHAHPVALVAFSICGQSPDPRAFNRAHTVCGEVGFAPYALPGSRKLGQNIAEEFARGFNCVMLENHGVVVGGANLQEAFERFETLEFTACILLNSKPLRRRRQIPDAGSIKNGAGTKVGVPNVSSRRCHTQRGSVTPGALDHRGGYRQRLLTAAQGSFSARLERNRFVITPAEVDRARIKATDLVLIDGALQESGKEASRSVALHAAIYRKHPEH